MAVLHFQPPPWMATSFLCPSSCPFTDLSPHTSVFFKGSVFLPSFWEGCSVTNTRQRYQQGRKKTLELQTQKMICFAIDGASIDQGFHGNTYRCCVVLLLLLPGSTARLFHLGNAATSVGGTRECHPSPCGVPGWHWK